MKRSPWIAGGLLALALAGQTSANDLLVWLEQPTGEQRTAASPPGANSAAGGDSWIDCKVEADGRLSGCKADGDWPTGVGYDKAALELSQYYRLDRAKSALGTPDRVRFQVALRSSGITGPDWIARPTASDVSQVFPSRAIRLGRSGSVVIECTVNTRGLFEACSVLSETPAGYGFGSAALSLAPLFKMRPSAKDGVPLGGARIRAPINFNYRP